MIRSLLALTSLLATTAAAAEIPPPELEQTRELMAFVRGAADKVLDEGLDSACEDFRDRASPWFQGESYVFVFDGEGTALCHPARPELEGQSLLELRDPHGKPIVSNFLRELEGEKQEGWTHYLWPTPGQQTFYWKSTYLRRIEVGDSSLVVGSGLYEMPLERFFIVEQVEDAVALIAREGIEAFETLRDPSSGFRFLNAYVFVMAEDGTELVNAAFPEVEGTDMLDFEDTTGFKVSREMLRVVRENGAGWVDYQWPKPGSTEPSLKSSYVRGVRLGEEFLVVGAGVYFE